MSFSLLLLRRVSAQDEPVSLQLATPHQKRSLIWASDNVRSSIDPDTHRSRSKRDGATEEAFVTDGPQFSLAVEDGDGFEEGYRIGHLVRGLRNPIRSFLSFPDSSPDRLRTPVGIPEFLQGIGGGVEAHVAKLESEIGDFNKLLISRTLKLKKLGIPCKHRKLMLKYAHKYRVGLWRPRAEPVKA